MTKIDEDALRAAVLGYEQQLRDISGKMDAIRQKLRGPAIPRIVLGGDLLAPAEAKPARRKRHKISAAGRKAIADAQRARWQRARETGQGRHTKGKTARVA